MNDTRQGYAEKLKKKIEDRHSEIRRLAAKASEVKKENKIKHNQLLETLDIKRQELKSKVTEMEKAAKSSREELKKNVEILWEALQQKYDNAQSWLEKELGEDTIFNQFPRRLKDQ